MTIVCTDAAGVIEGRKADVISAAYYAVQTAIRTLTVENGTLDTAKVIQDAASVFDCRTVSNVRSHEVQKNVRASNDIFVPSAADLAHDSEKHVIEHRYEGSDVFTLNVVVSTGKGVIHDEEHSAIEPTIYVL